MGQGDPTHLFDFAILVSHCVYLLSPLLFLKSFISHTYHYSLHIIDNIIHNHTIA
jgi:hypothetical protein